MRASAMIAVSLTITIAILEILAIRTERSTRPEVEHYRTYKSAPNGIIAYLPARFNSMPWALQRVQQNNPNVVAAYLPNQYGSPESKPWALPPRFHDTPNVVAAYLPAQYPSAMTPWRLPLQTSAPSTRRPKSIQQTLPVLLN